MTKEEERTAKAVARFDRTKQLMHDMAENPDTARCTIGAIALELMATGVDVTADAIIEELSAAAHGRRSGTINEMLAKGALKVISDLRKPEGSVATPTKPD